MIRLCIVIFILFVAHLIYPLNAQGITTVTWVQTTQSDFDKGALDSISTYSTGEITLSPMTEKINDITEPYVWCMTSNVYGTVYVGTGEPGTIYKIPDAGSSSIKKEAIMLYRSSELHVHSIAVDSNGNIYAGTSPHGIIYKITPEGQTIIWCQLPAPYIWSMAFDSKGNLYAATGDGGIIYKISDDGEATVLFDSPESHILTLVIDENDNIYGGSEPNGIIYKVKVDGRAAVLYDAREGEIHCLALDRNSNLFAGTASGGQPRIPTPSQQEPQQPEVPGYSFSDTEHRIGIELKANSSELAFNETLLDDGQFDMRSTQPQKPGFRYPEAPPRMMGIPVGPNAVYKVTPEGHVKKIFEVQNAFIFGLAVDENNDLYIGTGNGSRIYKITRNEDITITLMDIQESQVLALHAYRGDGVYVGTGNNGSVLKVSRYYTSEGTYISSIHDASFISKWGRITWMSNLPDSTKLTLATRTGNSSKPDSTWSEWSDEYTGAPINNGHGEVIKSSQARFIQYQARLSTSNRELSPVLYDVSVAYLPHNQAPRVSSVEVESKREGRQTTGMLRQKSYGSRIGEEKPQDTRYAEQRPLYEQATKAIFWKADDPNNDRLSYKLYYKAIDEQNWKGLAEGFYDTDYYLWDTSRVPDGRYQVKIVASDEPDNPPELAISAEKVCTPFIIDNTRPRVMGLEATIQDDKQCGVKGIARDDTCAISKIQYSLDATDWVSIFPDDQIFDAEEETFQFLAPVLSKGEHTIVVNAFDSEGNVGSDKIVVNVE
ncbi:MAG: hypothetical protein HYW14_01555 [Planctomycetes bacterium]|nr:hypothetical protein [Planctomycetota bacterium]